MRNKIKNNEDVWTIIFLQISLVIFVETVKIFSFKINEIDISVAMLLLPVTYSLSNYITKKYDYKYSGLSIILSTVLTMIFMIVMAFAVKKSIVISSMFGEAFAFLVSQIINIVIYNFLYKNTRYSYVLILFNYLFSLVFFHMIYTLSYINTMNLEHYWMKYFITLGLQVLICIPLTFIDKKLNNKKKKADK